MLRVETLHGWNYVLRVRELRLDEKCNVKVACGETNACWIISYDEPCNCPTQTQLIPLSEAEKPEGLP